MPKLELQLFNTWNQLNTLNFTEKGKFRDESFIIRYSADEKIH